MINNRQEILFIYDVSDANPNGDPLDENKPRIDEETGINIVTDVRLKRTIRDYLYFYKGFSGEGDKDIFVREVAAEKKGLKDGKARAKDFSNSKDEVLKRAIDIRLFGGVIPLDKDSITFTGPVQFNMGRSLNKVTVNHIKGTGAFASQEGKDNKTFREEYILPYSLIAFHGIINENAAKETNLTDEDIELLNEAIWQGTKNLITRSKMGHMPRFLIRVIYKQGQNFFIGDLHKKVRISSDLTDEKIRGISDFKLDISELLAAFKKQSDKIEKIIYTVDDGLKLLDNEKPVGIDEISGVKVEKVIY
ncbi:MAG TPA: type I-B CRISPR-associated protein Cas7/Csh2 [Pseudobacteroides sp.]|nr:type I-B CRISPR-associated protein Cas7/Csh2 [Pseudobacteroides sp.]